MADLNIVTNYMACIYRKIEPFTEVCPRKSLKQPDVPELGADFQGSLELDRPCALLQGSLTRCSLVCPQGSSAHSPLSSHVRPLFKRKEKWYLLEERLQDIQVLGTPGWLSG